MTHRPTHIGRRHWLRHTAGLALLGPGAGLALLGRRAAPLALNLAALGAASAQSTAGASDYKALVCVFLYGGNDSFNMLLPTDPASWAAYTATRNQAPDPIALQLPGAPWPCMPRWV